jgi:hypothetical protein
MLQGLLQLGRATKHDEKKTHRTYTLLWPVFQKAAEGLHALYSSTFLCVMHRSKQIGEFIIVRIGQIIIVQNTTTH